MDTKLRERLTEHALAIEKFRNLDLQEQEWLRPMLSRGFKSTILLLDEIAEERKTFEEIAIALGINAATVAQKLNALLQGGIAIDLSATAAFAPTGRPRKLARR